MSCIDLMGSAGCTIDRFSLVNGCLTMALVKDGEVYEMSSEDYYILSERLRRDLLSYMIPHTRIIGVQVVSNGITDAQYINKLNGTDTSYAELLVSLSKLVYGSLCTNNGLQEKVILASVSRSVTTEPGCIRIVEDRSQVLKTLFTGLNFMNWVIKGEANTFVKFVALRSTGLVDFHQASEHLRGMPGGEYMPLRAVYDLMQVFTVHKFFKEDQPECIRLHYKSEIDEDVLKSILYDYMSTISFEEVEI